MSITITPEQLKTIDEALIDCETAIGFLSGLNRHDWPEDEFSPDRAGAMLTAQAQASLKAAGELMDALRPA